MTILFLSRLFAPHIGGVETHLLEISKRLVQKNHRVIIITEKFEPALLEYENIDGIEVYRINPGKDNWFKKFYIWREVRKLQELIQQSDVVHCHDVFFWYLPFRFLYPFKKVYTTFHGYETQVPPRRGAMLIRKISEKLSYGNICIGSFIEKWYGTNATFVTYGGTVFEKNKIKKIDLKNKLNITLVGRLSQDIGITTYLKVLDLLNDSKISFTFEAYGDGPLRKNVEKFGKVHGFTKNVKDAIGDSDIIFVSSYLSMLDALAQKKLVFAVYENKLKEDYLKMSPFAEYILIENDPVHIANKIIYFKTHTRELEKLLEKGYAFAQTQTWDNVTGLYLKLWKK